MTLLTLMLAVLLSGFMIQAPPVERLTVEVINEYPHDPDAFTQGLLLHDGLFYESTGRYGLSTLRQVQPETGDVLQSVNLPAYLFAEGLALVDGTLIQLTWRENVALLYDLESFSQGVLTDAALVTYPGEGWGLCYDGETVYRSDGSSSLFLHDAATFEVLGEIAVTLDGEPLPRLNELECVGENIYANVWQTDEIMRIDKASGEITAVIDASGLLDTPAGTQTGTVDSLLFDSQNQRFVVQRSARGGGAVLNGIAYNPASDTFFITGKLWPTMFEVRFVPGA